MSLLGFGRRFAGGGLVVRKGTQVLCTVMFSTLMLGSAAWGDPCEVPDNGGGTVTLPPAGCEYLSPEEVHEIVDGLPPGTTIELAAIHKGFVCRPQGTPGSQCSFPAIDCSEFGGSLGGEQECAASVLELSLTGTGELEGFSRVIPMPVHFETHIGPRTPGESVQSFPTEMFRLVGQLPPGDPDFDLLVITAGTDFGMPSPGHTTLTSIGGGQWRVDSFFDITYRIEFQGAPGGVLDGLSGITNGALQMRTNGNGGPAASSWGILALVLAVAAGATVLIRRRHVAVC